MNARNFSVVSSILLGLLVLVPVLGMSLIGGWAITGPGMFGGLGMAYGPVVGATFLLVLVASIATIVFFLTRRSDPVEALERRKRVA